MLITKVVIGFFIILSILKPSSTNTKTSEDMKKKEYILKPIGMVRHEKEHALLVIHKDLIAALKGLEGFSHVWVIWWFNRNDKPEKRSVLQVHPQGNKRNPMTGIFACRAPVRPNLIGLTLCRIVSIRDSVIEIENIDAKSNTPILDLKPYIPMCDSVIASVPDWINHR